MASENINIETGEVVPCGRMTTSGEIAELAAALAKAQGVIEGASKDASNPFFKSKYADLGAVWDACRRQLSENGLCVLQAPSASGSAVSVETMLAHSSGQWVRSTLTVTAKDDSPQSVGSAISYLRRYALQSIVGVAPADDDGEAAQGRGEAPARRQEPRSATPKAVKEPEASKALDGKPPADPLTDMDVLMVSDAAKAAGFKTRGELLPLLGPFGGGAPSLKLMDRSFLADLMGELKRLAGPKAPTPEEVASDVSEFLGPETGE